MAEPDRSPTGAPPGMPRWVKISAVVAGLLLGLFLLLKLTGLAGDHGPQRHLSGMPAGGAVASAVAPVPSPA
ncbi:hypothetical protein [Blastococcus sp. PRF04-17]|uniref:hypothetical protein n=1 Tax=Blastococcus sp. PRF04-17 TaxID=2933797 RepID=UPI001FF6BC9A|nr:hypothetical protein [Blastococcus sp. PRF04-17]UOY03087.1 hypothetical protein MVA48_06985 [Blastococcus sp. PRF04-17]